MFSGSFHLTRSKSKTFSRDLRAAQLSLPWASQRVEPWSHEIATHLRGLVTFILGRTIAAPSSLGLFGHPAQEVRIQIHSTAVLCLFPPQLTWCFFVCTEKGNANPGTHRQRHRHTLVRLVWRTPFWGWFKGTPRGKPSLCWVFRPNKPTFYPQTSSSHSGRWGTCIRTLGGCPQLARNFISRLYGKRRGRAVGSRCFSSICLRICFSIFL